MRLTANHVHITPMVQKQVGSIHLPPSLVDSFNTGGVKLYRVLGVGPGRVTRKGVRVDMECASGDRVLCHSYTSGPITLDDGSMIITDDQIIAVLPNNHESKT